MSDTLDDYAFAAACEATPDVDPEQVRLAVDAYMATLHLHVVRASEGRTLTPAEAEDSYRLRAPAS